MDRLIKVKGIGNVSVKPDLIVISIDLESHDHNYEKMLKIAANSVNNLVEAIKLVGFSENDLKTTNFNIRTHYKSYRDKDDNYKSKFDGYICEQQLKIEFDFSTDTMGKILTEIAKTSTNPQLNIQFSVKDKSAISEDLLISATENAKRKAEILTKAAGVSLGNLLSIEYSWGELHLYSPTRFDLDDRMMLMSESSSPNIVPDDIELSDTVAYIWEIK